MRIKVGDNLTELTPETDLEQFAIEKALGHDHCYNARAPLATYGVFTQSIQTAWLKYLLALRADTREDCLHLPVMSKFKMIDRELDVSISLAYYEGTGRN